MRRACAGLRSWCRWRGDGYSPVLPMWWNLRISRSERKWWNIGCGENPTGNPYNYTYLFYIYLSTWHVRAMRIRFQWTVQQVVFTTSSFKLLKSQELTKPQTVQDISAEEVVGETAATTEDNSVTSDGKIPRHHLSNQQQCIPYHS